MPFRILRINDHQLAIRIASAAPAYTGVLPKVARSLNVDASHVRRVAIGERHSKEIVHALAMEVLRVESEIIQPRTGQ